MKLKMIILEILLSAFLIGCGYSESTLSEEPTLPGGPYMILADDIGSSSQYVGYIKSYRINSYNADSFSGTVFVYIPDLAENLLGGCAVNFDNYEDYFYVVSKLGEEVLVDCITTDSGELGYSLTFPEDVIK